MLSAAGLDWSDLLWHSSSGRSHQVTRCRDKAQGAHFVLKAFNMSNHMYCIILQVTGKLLYWLRPKDSAVNCRITLFMLPIVLSGMWMHLISQHSTSQSCVSVVVGLVCYNDWLGGGFFVGSEPSRPSWNRSERLCFWLERTLNKHLLFAFLHREVWSKSNEQLLWQHSARSSCATQAWEERWGFFFFLHYCF